MTLIEPLAGTEEAEWAAWEQPARWPEQALDELTGRPVVVLAAHPDDEMLAVGGLLHLLVRAGSRPTIVWASDGEASHPGSAAAGRLDIGAVRRSEARASLTELGLGGCDGVFLGLPDGALAEQEERLTGALALLLTPGCVVLASWSGDGHPDHDACGRAARVVAADVPGSRLLEYPVWMWHWARPDDPRVPWRRARRVPLDAATRTRKQRAIACHRSQVRPLGDTPADGPVLPPRVLAHFVGRAQEVLLA